MMYTNIFLFWMNTQCLNMCVLYIYLLQMNTQCLRGIQYINVFLMNIQSVSCISIYSEWLSNVWIISTCSEWIPSVCVLYILYICLFWMNIQCLPAVYLHTYALEWIFSFCMLHIYLFWMNMRDVYLSILTEYAWCIFVYSILNEYSLSACCISFCYQWISSVCVLYIRQSFLSMSISVLEEKCLIWYEAFHKGDIANRREQGKVHLKRGEGRAGAILETCTFLHPGEEGGWSNTV